MVSYTEIRTVPRTAIVKENDEFVLFFVLADHPRRKTPVCVSWTPGFPILTKSLESHGFK